MLNLSVNSDISLRVLLLNFSLQLFNVQDLGVTEDGIDERGTNENDGLASFLQIKSGSTQEREVNGGVSFFRLEDDALAFGVVDNVLSLEVQDSLFLLLGGVLQALVVLEDSGGSINNSAVVDAPQVAELVEDVSFSVKSFDGLFTSDEVQSDGTIGNSGGSQKLDPTDFRSVVSMSTAAGFDVSVFDVDDSELVTGDDTTLVESETEFKLSLGLVHEVLLDGLGSEDNSVGFVFNFDFFLLGDTGIMGDVQMGLVDGLLSTSLPDVGSEDLSAGSEDDVSGSVMVSELSSSFFIDGTSDFHAFIVRNIVLGKRSVEDVEDTLADLFTVDNGVGFSVDLEGTNIVGLTTGSGVERTSVKDNNVSSIVLLEVGENVQDLALESEIVGVRVEKIVSFSQMGGVVEDDFSNLGSLFLILSNFVVKVIRNGLSTDLGNNIDGNTQTGNSDLPILKFELLLLLDHSFELDTLTGISVGPSFIFDLDNAGETLVFRESTVDTFEILLMHLAKFNETFELELVPPSVLLEEGENSSEDVSDVTTTTGVGG